MVNDGRLWQRKQYKQGIGKRNFSHHICIVRLYLRANCLHYLLFVETVFRSQITVSFVLSLVYIVRLYLEVNYLPCLLKQSLDVRLQNLLSSL